MALSFINNALGASNSTTSFSITLPATAAGDIIILEFCHRGAGDGTIGGTYSGPAFALKHSQLFASSAFSGKTYWSRATGNHTGQTVAGSGLTNSCAAIVTVYRGALASGDPLADATIVGEQNASTNETQAEISNATAAAWVVLVVVNSPDLAVATQACTTPGTLTGRAERLSTGGTDSSVAHASAEKAGTGGTGAFTWTQADAASGSWAYAITPEGTVYDETVRTVTALALVALTDLQRLKELAAAVPAVAVVTTSDAQRYQDLGLAVPLTAVVSAAEAQHYADTGLPIPVTGTVSVADAIKFDESGLAITAVGVVAATDEQAYRDAGLVVDAQGQVTLGEALHALDLGLPVTIVGTATAADVQAYREAALAVSMAVAVTLAAETQHGVEGLALTAQVQAALADLQHYQDLGVEVPLTALVSVADSMHGTAPFEDLSVVVVGTVSAQDFAHRLEAALPVEAQAILTGTDEQHYGETLAALLQATVYAWDLQHYQEALQAIAQGQVRAAESQRFQEVGLLAGIVATVTVADAMREARPGVPLFVFSTPYSARGHFTTGWGRNLQLPARPPRYLEYHTVPVVGTVDVSETPH